MKNKSGLTRFLGEYSYIFVFVIILIVYMITNNGITWPAAMNILRHSAAVGIIAVGMGMICLTGYAHIIDEMLLYFDQTHTILHGLRVGFATIAMLIAENASKTEILTYLRFCRQIGIPTSLKALGLDQISLDEWHKAYNATVGISGNDRMLPFNTTSDSIINSLLETDSIIQSIE